MQMGNLFSYKLWYMPKESLLIIPFINPGTLSRSPDSIVSLILSYVCLADTYCQKADSKEMIDQMIVRIVNTFNPEDGLGWLSPAKSNTSLVEFVSFILSGLYTK